MDRIEFPLTAYGSQQTFMAKVMECLNQGVNGVLESPAGTGKTLGLLCPSMAWLRRRRQQDRVAWRVVYASRTYAQAEWAREELRRTAYSDAEVAVVGAPETGNLDDLTSFSQRVEEAVCAGADIIFVPHFFLLHPYLRSLRGLSLRNSVVLLDDGHHVPTACEEAFSARITSQDLNDAVAQFAQVVCRLQQQPEEASDGLTADVAAELQSVVEAMQQAVDDERLVTAVSGPNRGKREGKALPGTHIFTLLEKAGVLPHKTATVMAGLNAYAEWVASRDGGVSGGDRAIFRLTVFLGSVINSINQLDDFAQLDLNFRVYIEPEVKDRQQTAGKVVNFWCFNPSLAMKSLEKQGVTSIVLAGGALSPLRSTVAELGIAVTVQLENPHIVQPSQVSVVSLSTGPTGHDLSSSFSNRDRPDYLSELGRAVRDLCGVVPGGMLVTFPSYTLMHAAINNWEATGLRQEIDQQQKPLFLEPQSREDLAPVMAGYCHAVEAAGSRGAVLLAVMRGKVVEEVDLAGAQCRAVVVVGVPYLPSLSPRVNLKRLVLRSTRQGLSEEHWYQMQALRAINQAVGRLTRRVDDYGVVLLCDGRYKNHDFIRQLSAWLQPCLSHCNEWQAACRKISGFLVEQEQELEKKKILERIFRPRQ